MRVNRQSKILVLIISFFWWGCSNSECNIPNVMVSRGDLTVGFLGNIPGNDHCMSGVSFLQNQNLGPIEVVRENAALLNFEHILTGFPDGRAKSGFTPREGPFPITLLPGGDGVQIIRQVKDEEWKVSSTLTLRVVPPHYIDFDFAVTFDDASLFDPDAVFFFANSMKWVSDSEIHFPGYFASSETEEWVKSKANHVDPGDSYIGNTSQGAPFDPYAPILVEMNLKSEAEPQITQPFFYGHTGGNSVFALMFDHLKNEESEVRFTVMRWDLHERPSPYWDFSWVVYHPQEGQQAHLKGRLLFKRFISNEDIYDEYLNWQEGLAELASP